MGEWRPGRRHPGALGLGRGRLRLGAADGGDAAFAARDALRRLMQIADRALAADRAVIEMRRLDAEPIGKQLFRIAVAPAQEIDDVERADIAEQFCRRSPPPRASALLRAGSRGSSPAAISLGRSTISPTPTMTGMRSSGRDIVIFLFFSLICRLRLRRHCATASSFAGVTDRSLRRWTLLAMTEVTPPPARSCARRLR